MDSLALSHLVSDKPEGLIPRQVKLLGATVKGVGVVTTVSKYTPWCYALIEDEQGLEHHAFISDLTKDNVTFPETVLFYREATRRIGYGLWDDVYELTTVPFSDLTHVDQAESEAA